MKLNQIAIIKSGLVLSRKLSKFPSQVHYPVLTLRSLHPNGDIEAEQLEAYDASEELNPEYLTKNGDVVFRLSAPYTATLICNHTQGIVISSNFAVIRPDCQKLLPEYLVWLLNTPKVKRQIYENATSNMLGSVRATWFAEFEIPPLSLEEQRKVATLHALAKQEIQALVRLTAEKEKYYASLTEKLHESLKKENLP